MTNIEKLLDALVKSKGEKLVIGGGEPPYIFKGGQKAPLLAKALSEGELRFLDREFSQTFLDLEQFEYGGIEIQLQRSGDAREFVRLTPMDVAPPPQAPSYEPPVEKPQGPRQPEILELLRRMTERKSSDLHLSVKCRPMLRVDGDMQEMPEYEAFNEESLWNELQKITPERNRTEFEEVNDTDFAYELPGVARFRTNVFRDHRGIGAVLRRIPTTILSAAELDIPQVVLELCQRPKGLILVTGPTGSGKSTTLAALIHHINQTTRKHIITIEDPVEFIHHNQLSLVNQREIGTHTQSFKHALRAALREDPDVVLVGEMRDLETIAIAIETAVTGHLVFGTLHTSTAVGTVDRIIDQFPPTQQAQIRTMLSDALIGVVAQMLCKRKTGGRVAAYEVMVVNVAISNLIREGKTFQIPTLMQTGKAMGMRMLSDHLAELVEKGVVEAEEALSKASDKEVLKGRLRSKGLME